MKKGIAIAVTIVIGYLGTVLGAELLNWPQLGPIAAIAAMGYCILSEIEKKK